MTVDTPVEQTEPIHEYDEEPSRNEHTDHPISITVHQSTVRTAFDAECEKSDDVDRIYDVRETRSKTEL